MTPQIKLKAVPATAETPWKTLQRDEFRILRITAISPQVVAEFEIYRFEKLKVPGRYDALSYAWEGQQPDVEMIVDGVALKITPTVHQAITSLYSSYIRMLFVDSICINQNAPTEKKHQVSIMHKIYRNAERTIAWLGPAADESDLAFDYMNNMQYRSLRTPAISKMSQSEDILQAIGFSDLSADVIRAFARLAQRPWLNRLWVVQEVVFARKYVVVCGKKEVDGLTYGKACAALVHVNLPGLARETLKWPVEECLRADFTPAISIAEASANVAHNRYRTKNSPNAVLMRFMKTSHFKKLHTRQQLALADLTSNPNIQDADDVDEQVMRIVGELTLGRKLKYRLGSGFNKIFKHDTDDDTTGELDGEPIPLFLDMVQRCRTRDVTEPVDHIYGLLGFLEKDDPYYGKVVVDYTPAALLSFLDLYKSFASTVLTVEKKLKLLHLTSSLERPDGLPSWCPNFACGPETSRMTDRYEAGWPKSVHKSPQCSVAHPHFTADSGRNGSLTDPDTICLWGTKLDVVKKIGSPSFSDFASPDFASQDHETVMKGWEILIKWYQESWELAQELSKDDSDALPEHFWRTMIGDCDYINDDAFPAGDQMLEESRLAAAYILKVMAELYKYSSDNYEKFAYNTLQKHLGECADAIPRAAAYIQHLHSFWKNRRFLVTEGGRMGFASQRTRQGDIICALYSGPSVYVLREHADTGFYEFIDDAFIHTLMQGEAFELLDEGKAFEQQFLIR